MIKFPKLISAAFLTLLLTFNTAFTANAQTKLIFEENFKKNLHQKKWLTVNGSWEVKDEALYGNKDVNWAILLANKPLPEDYVLTFLARAAPKTYLFEVMLNLNGSKFLGILLNQLESKVAIEDRSLFADLENRGTFVHSTGHIGIMPKVARSKQTDWQDWKIQRSGNQFFIWINQKPIISFKDKTGFVKPKGQFGFAINGEAAIKDLKVWQIKGEDALPPKSFKSPPLLKPFFVFE